MRRRLTVLSVVVALVALLAGTAHATSCVGPPGLGAVDQYCEVVPTSGGHAGGGTKHTSKPLPTATRLQLQQAGSDGQGVLALAQTAPATAPKKHATSKKKARNPAPASGSTPVATPTPVVASSGALDAVGHAVVDGPAVGRWLPFALLALALGAGALALRRRSRD